MNEKKAKALRKTLHHRPAGEMAYNSRGMIHWPLGTKRRAYQDAKRLAGKPEYTA